MSTLLQDLRYAVRRIPSGRGTSVLAILLLAVGVGVTTAAFATVRRVLLTPLPFPHPERLVRVWRTEQGRGARFACCGGDFAAWAPLFDHLAAAITSSTMNLVGVGEPATMRTWQVSADFFATLGRHPLIGRGFQRDEREAVVLGERLWTTRFGRDPGVLGRAVHLNDKTYTVVGVVPADVDLSTRSPADLYVLLDEATLAAQAGECRFRAYARLAPNQTIGAVQSSVQAVAPPTAAHWTAWLEPLHDTLTARARQPLTVLAAAALLMLLAVCANVASLLLALAGGRAHEVAVRRAVGAGSGQILRQFAVEGGVLALMGGALGLAMAAGLLSILRWATSLVERSDAVAGRTLDLLDANVLAFALMVSLLTGFLVSLAPAWHLIRHEVQAALQSGGRGRTGTHRSGRVSAALVAGELAMAMALLVCAGLLLRSLNGICQVDPGFDPRGLVSTGLTIANAGQATGTRNAGHVRAVMDAMRAVPGVESVAAVSLPPLGKYNDRRAIRVAGRLDVQAEVRVATAGYFSTMRIPLTRGQWIASDTEANHAVAVDRAFVERYLSGLDPIGTLLTIDGREVAVSAVVGDVKLRQLDESKEPHAYVAMADDSPASMTLVFRSERPIATVEPEMRRAVSMVDAWQPLEAFSSMEAVVRESQSTQRFGTLALGLLAAVALLLAAAGHYGLVAQVVGQRTREIGIRMAFGARPQDILRLFLGQMGWLIAVGLVCGAAIALAGGRIVTSLLFGVTPTDVTTFAVVSVILSGVALAASYFPARRAARVDPMVALRCE